MNCIQVSSRKHGHFAPPCRSWPHVHTGHVLGTRGHVLDIPGTCLFIFCSFFVWITDVSGYAWTRLDTHGPMLSKLPETPARGFRPPARWPALRRVGFLRWAPISASSHLKPWVLGAQGARPNNLAFLVAPGGRQFQLPAFSPLLAFILKFPPLPAFVLWRI